jgi:hypothetical protein
MPLIAASESLLRRLLLHCFVAATTVIALTGCGAPSAPTPTTAPTVPTAAATPLPTASFGLTLPFPKEADLGQKPVFTTIEDVPIMGFYVNNGGLVLAPHEASLVEVLLVTEPTAWLSEGGIVLNFIHPAGFASQVYLWHGQAVQTDKSGGYRPMELTAEQPSISYGPVYRGQVVGIVGEPFQQAQFKGASLLLTLAQQGGKYVPPDTLWLFGKPQYIATPTP